MLSVVSSSRSSSSHPQAAIPKWPLGVASASHSPNHCHWIASHSTGRSDQTRRTISFTQQSEPTEVASFLPCRLVFCTSTFSFKGDNFCLFFARGRISEPFFLFVCFFQYGGINWKQTSQKTINHSEIKKKISSAAFLWFIYLCSNSEIKLFNAVRITLSGANFAKSTAMSN